MARNFDASNITYQCPECKQTFKGNKCGCGWEREGDLHFSTPCCICGEPATKHGFDGKTFWSSDKYPNKGKRYCYNHLQKAYAEAYKVCATMEQIERFKAEWCGIKPSVRITMDENGEIGEDL